MKATAGVLLMALASFSLANAETTSPIAKVLEMIGDLQTKIIGEGEASQKIYEEFSEWCEEQSKSLSFEIKTGKAEVEALTATIEEETATIGSLTTKIEELSGAIATDERDLKAATEIRAEENAVFVAEEKDLSGIIDTLTRAIGILEKEMAKGGAAMLQMKNVQNVAQALTVMVQASALNAADADRLTALAQTSSKDGDDDMGAPAGAVYEHQEGGIIATMTDLLDKAQAQLDAARKKETTNLNNFEMIQQSLEDQIKNANSQLEKAKKALAASGEKKATAEGDLAVTTKDLNSDIKTLADTHHDCMTKATDFEAETKSRGEELAAMAEAKKILVEATGGAAKLSYGLSQVSFLQLTSGSGEEIKVVRFVRALGKKHKSTQLMQLAARIASAVRFGAGSGADPFAKVKGLIADMITKLEEEGEADATHEAYCDKEIAESDAKHADKTAEIDKLTTSIDSMSTKSAKLKEEVAALQKALADLAKSQSEMDKLRSEEKALYETNKAEMEKGLEGVKLALKVLTEYYASEGKSHAANEGAGGGIIDLLEVVESDFSKGLAEMIATEESAQAAYETETKENEIDKANKDQDVKYKTKESTDLDKAVAEATSDKENVQAELDAVNEYLAKLHEECDEKVEPYEETKRRREAEIAGLKEALEILSGDAVLLQRSSRHLRGVVQPHVHA
jgi:predicted  nucleic acid-binding Zn-ribbon protein